VSRRVEPRRVEDRRFHSATTGGLLEIGGALPLEVLMLREGETGSLE